MTPDDQPDPTGQPGQTTEPALPRATALRRALGILGDPWTMLILKEAFNGQRRFIGFQRALNIPRQTLTLRLAALCRDQMLYRRHVSADHARLEYAPTAKALDLDQAMYAVWLWHRANPGDRDVLPFDIIHRDCGKVIGASFRCQACGGAVNSSTVSIRPADPPQFDPEPRPRLSRRNDAAFVAAGPGAGDEMLAASLVGDIPCNEILWLLFQAPGNLLAIAAELGLGVPVVRGRLDKLQALGLIGETRQGRRLVFSVLPRAEGFFPLLLAITAWGDRWCNAGDPPPEVIVHECGALLSGRYACDHCGGWLGRGNLTVRPHQTPE